MIRSDLILNYSNINNDTIYKNSMIEWIINKIDDFISLNNVSGESLLYYMAKNLMLVSVTFNRDRIERRKLARESVGPIGDTEFQQFSHFYNMVCREILGQRFDSLPPTDKPFCIAALDAEGSRLWREMGLKENLHIHSIWVMRPDTTEKFQRVRERTLSMDILDFDQIHVGPFETGTGLSLPKLVSYVLKFELFNQPAAEVPDAFRFYPFVKDGPKYDTASW